MRERINRRVETPQDITSLAQSTVQALMRQDLALAEKLAQQLLALQPTNPDGLHTMASCRYLQNRSEEALQLVQQALATNSPHHKLTYLMAGILFSLNREDEAIEAYRKTIALNPKMAMAHFQIGVIYHQRNQLEEAIACYHEAMKYDTKLPYPLNNLATAYNQLGRPDEAIAILQKLVENDPKHYNAYNNLGLGYYHKGLYAEAADAYAKALATKPDFVDALYNLGLLRYREGRYKEAIAAYEEAIRINPKYDKAIHNLGLLYYDIHQHDKAIAYYKKTLEVSPDYLDALNNLGLAYGQQGNMEEARQYFGRALQLRPEMGIWAFRAGNLCPILMRDEAEIPALRERLQAHVESFLDRDITVQLDEMTSIDCRPPFYLPYHGLDDLPLKRLYAQFIEGLFRRSGYEELMEKPGPTGNAIPHIGFIVTNGHELAFIKVIGGILKHFPKDQFRVSVVCSRMGARILTQLVGTGDFDYVVMPDRLEASIRFIKTLRLDVVYLLEVGTDPPNYYLSFFNLAPVQVTSWGFPETSAVPGLDYFLSSRHWEPEGAQAHYSETLVQFDRLPVYYQRPILTEPLKSRSELNLPESGPLYACIQQLFKFQPHFDRTLAQLLREDPEAKLVMIRSKHRYQNELICERLARHIPNLKDRLVFAPKYGNADYLNLLSQPDVVFLDTPDYDGGVTSYDAMAMGAATVTMSGPFMRSRKTAGCYRQMGVTDCIAESPEDYIAQALKLAHDADYRHGLQARIREASGELYEDMAMVRELQDFFRQVAGQASLQPASLS